MRLLLSLAMLTALCSSVAWGHPEFQRYSKEVSQRAINCAMCHTHSDGPEGMKAGQIGRLDEEQMNALGVARQAFRPGSGVINPILNQFGNAMLNDLGKDRISELRQRPDLLAAELSKTRDMDGDGILDSEEFLDGTHPLNSLDGHPWKLFKHNFSKNGFHVFMMTLATLFGLFSLRNLLLWLSSKVAREK